MIRWAMSVVALVAVISLGFGYKEWAKWLGFSDTQIAVADVLRQRVGDTIQKAVGQGDIALQEYNNKIQDVKDKLIRVKVLRKTYEAKLQKYEAQLTDMEKYQPSSEQAILLRDTTQEVEKLLADLQKTETTLEGKLKKMVAQLDVVKLKISTLEAKAEMLKIQTELQDYSSLESDVSSNLQLIDKATEDLTQTIYTLQAQQELEQQLRQLESKATESKDSL